MSQSRIWVVALLALIAAVPARAKDVLNPEVFNKSVEAALQAADFYGAYDNVEELERVTDIGHRIAQESSFKDFPFSFYLVDMPVPNAFALPGGQVFATKGMLDLGLTDDMLAGLLGHEIGHVVLQHGMKMQRRATLLNVLSQALLVGVMVSASNGGSDTGPAPPGYDPSRSGSGDRVMGAAAAGLVVSELLLRNYSREFEDQADDEGIRLAAGAGFDPDGFERLMSLMNERLPQSKEFGYWRTHPFFESRVRAAAVRKDLLKVQEARSADEYRAATQKRLLRLAKNRKLRSEQSRFLEDTALTTWPKGKEARRIRIARLHEFRDQELENGRLSRDYGKLLTRYEEELNRARALDEEDEVVDKIAAEMDDFRDQLGANYDDAAGVFEEGIFETEFLEVFASNYPDAEEFPRIALALGEAYSRLRDPERAVEMLMAAWQAGPETDAGKRAERGLLSLASTLNELGALQNLSDQETNAELGAIAGRRLGESVGTFEQLGNGASYLKNYPDSDYSEAVNSRLDELAESLYAEAILYQQIGDHTKAQDRIQRILTHAPLSSAAARLRVGSLVES